MKRHGRADVEAKLGEESDSPFFWVGGLMRENYDLIYPYLRRDGTRKAMEEFTSREIYNFDLCARSLPLSGAPTPAREVLSGAVREWLPDAIVARLLDNRVIPEPPVFRDGEIENIDELGGYGPFLMARAVATRPASRPSPRPSAAASGWSGFSGASCAGRW